MNYRASFVEKLGATKTAKTTKTTKTTKLKKIQLQNYKKLQLQSKHCSKPLQKKAL